MKPRSGYKLRILGGIIYHITGTNTYLSVRLPGAAAMVDLHRVDSLIASTSFVLNNRITTDVTTSVDTTEFWIYGPAYLYFFCAATGGADIMVEEIKLARGEQPEEETRK